MSVVAVNISPTSGETIARQDALSFRALFDDLGSIVVAVTYPDGRREVVFSGGAFAPVFAFASTISITAPGEADLSVLRTGGWNDPPTLDVSEAEDTVPGWGYPFGSA